MVNSSDQGSEVPADLDTKQPEQLSTAKLPNYLKISIIIVAASFLAYTIYWAIYGVIWFNTMNQYLFRVLPQIPYLTSTRALHFTLLFVQEYASVVNSLILLPASGIFGLYTAVLFINRNAKYKAKLRLAILFTALFFLLLVPASIHHLVGTALSLSGTNIYVGLSFLIQALLIVPPLLLLSKESKHPKNAMSVRKWVILSLPLIVFALWFKYLFLWIDTLSPMGSKEATIMSTLGAANSAVTLLIAGAIMTAGCYALSQKKIQGKNLVAVGLVVVGGFFIVYSLVALWEPIYSSFWYLTDFWMLTLPILGATILANKRLFKLVD